MSANNLKGQATIIGMIITLVTGIIGFVIVSGIVTPTYNSATYNNESFTAAAYATGNQLSNFEDGIVSGSDVVTNTTHTLTRITNYNISYTTGIINVSTDYENDTMSATYDYYPSEYLNSSISRTVIQYVVPVGLLGILAFAAFLSTR